MSHQNALNALIDGGLEPSHAQAVLALAFKYNCVYFPNLGPGSDSWGSTRKLTVQLSTVALGTEYLVKFEDRPNY